VYLTFLIDIKYSKFISNIYKFQSGKFVGSPEDFRRGKFINLLHFDAEVWENELV
jgi:hypothetical protein